MNPQDLAVWMRQEHDRVAELVYLVRRQLAVPPAAQRARWLCEARERFRRLADHLKRHMTLEEVDGYLSEVRTQRPNLSPEIERLQHEHGELEAIMRQLQATLDEVTADDNLLLRCCSTRIAMLLAYLEQHHQDEQRLVFHVFCDDLGAAAAA